MIQILFDSGARIEEFLNLKFKDVAWKKEYYTINIRVSKTKPRVISIPMKESTELMRAWLQDNQDKKQDDFLFEIKYHNAAITLKRIGEKAIGKNVHPHLFRHSSMTYYANHLKHYPFAKRYGLSLNSDVVNRYIDLSGVDEEETHNILKGNREYELEKQIQELQERNNILQEQINNVQGMLEELKNYPEQVLRRAAEIASEREDGKEHKSRKV
jgi:hypothetical protein